MAGSPEEIEKYTDLLINLLPKGKVWTPKEQPVFLSLLESFAVELCRVDGRVLDLLFEADPRQSLDGSLLDEWEELLGLPDECTPTGQTLQERQDQATQKLTNVGGLSESFYEFIAAQLGHIIEVTNRINFLAGRARAGDLLSNYFNRVFEAGDTAGTPLREIGWRFYWEARLPITAAEVFEAGDVAGTPLREFSNPLIECTLKQLKPAHSAIFFTFA